MKLNTLYMNLVKIATENKKKKSKTLTINKQIELISQPKTCRTALFEFLFFFKFHKFFKLFSDHKYTLIQF